jgi:hypothetical protein
MRRRRFFLSGDATVEMPSPVAAPKLFDAELPQRQMLLDPILSNDTLVPLYGPRGLGRTFVALGLAGAPPQRFRPRRGAAQARAERDPGRERTRHLKKPELSPALYLLTHARQFDMLSKR